MQLHALVGGSAEVIGPEATLIDAAVRMVECEVGYLAVISRRELVGILTEHDLMQATAEGVATDEAIVEDWMSEAPDTVPSDVSVREAAAWLIEAGYHHLPVIDGGELLGIVTVKDLLWAMLEPEASNQ